MITASRSCTDSQIAPNLPFAGLATVPQSAGRRRAAMILSESDRRSINMSALNAARRKVLWTKAEDDILRSLHSDRSAIANALPHRTAASIKRRLHDLGLNPSTSKVWTAKDVKRLRFLWCETTTPIEEIAKQFNVTQRSIRSRLHQYRIQRGSSQMMTQCSGIALLDQLFDHANKMRYSRADLDALAGPSTRKFFAERKWKTPVRKGFSPDWNPIVRAIIAAGGRVEAIFDDP